MTKQLLVAILGLFTAISVGAQPLQAQITTLDCKVQEAIGACIYNRRHLSQLAAAKDMNRGILMIEITTSCNWCGGSRYLVRLFDRNGNYLTHFVSRSFFEMMGYQEGAQAAGSPHSDDIQRKSRKSAQNLSWLMEQTAQKTAFFAQN